jgi:hypothetical protein
VAQENRKPKDITELPGVGPTTAEKLVESGFSTIEAIAVATPQEIAQAAGIPLQTAQKIVEAARQPLTYSSKRPLSLRRRG